MKRIIQSGVISALIFTPFTSSFAAGSGAMYSSSYLKDSLREYTIEFELDIPKGDQNNSNDRQDVYGDVIINSVNGSPANDTVFHETGHESLTRISWKKSYWSKSTKQMNFEMYVNLTDWDATLLDKDDTLCHWGTFQVVGPIKNQVIKSNSNCKLRIINFE